MSNTDTLKALINCRMTCTDCGNAAQPVWHVHNHITKSDQTLCEVCFQVWFQPYAVQQIIADCCG